MSKAGPRSAAAKRPGALRRARRSAPQAAAPDRGLQGGAVPDLPGQTSFFLDVDGTLLDIAAHPRLVRIDDELRRLLDALRKAAGGALALISGRSVAEIDRLFAGSGFCVAGQHGAERRDYSGRMHRHDVPTAGLRSAARRLRSVVAEHPALVLEDKGVNLALHYRLAPELGAAAREAVEKLVEELGGEFEMQAGKSVIEIRPSGRDKGVAIAEFLTEAPFRGRLPVFIGDDLTDEIGFGLMNRVGGCSVKVGEGESTARWRLPDASAVRTWLARFVAQHGGCS